MLRDAGLDLRRLEPAATRQVFKLFAAEPVEGVGSEPKDQMCLFECGVYDWSDGNGPRFNWSLCRQFTFYDSPLPTPLTVFAEMRLGYREPDVESGDYDRMEQLRCDLFFEPKDEASSLQAAEIWSDGSLEEWAEEVETSKGFRAVQGSMPIESRIGQNRV